MYMVDQKIDISDVFISLVETNRYMKIPIGKSVFAIGRTYFTSLGQEIKKHFAPVNFLMFCM